MHGTLIGPFLADESGQDNIEYGLLGALVAIVVLVLLMGFGAPLNSLYQMVLDALNLVKGS